MLIECVSRKGKNPHFLSFLGLSCFFGCWIFSPILPLIALYSYHSYKSTTIFHIYLLYYTYRFAIPVKQNMYFRKLFSYFLNKGYFNKHEIIIEGGKVEKDDKTLLLFHPHGALCIGWVMSVVSEILSYENCEIKWLVAEALIYIPFIKDFLGYFNSDSATSKTIKNLMKNNKNIAMIPGGFESAALFTKNQHRCYFQNRKGIIKYSLMYGYKLRPTYVFGEEKTYNTVNILEGFRLFLAKWKIPPVIFYSKYGFMPDPNIDIKVVVGKEIQFPRIDNPSQEDIEKWHKYYAEKLNGVFEKHKTCKNDSLVLL